MKTAIAAITFAVLISIPAYAGEYNISLECDHSPSVQHECVGTRDNCMSSASHAFDRLTQAQRRICEVNVSRR